MSGRRLSEEENALRLELYEKGYSDREIADEVGVARSAICVWRQRNNLEGNAKQGGVEGDRLSEENIQLRLSMIEQGLSDGEIAEQLGITKSAFTIWRNKRGIPPNRPRGGQRLPKNMQKRRIELYKRGFSDREIAEKIGISKSGVQRWRKREGIKSNFNKTFDFTSSWKLGYLVGLTCRDGCITKTKWKRNGINETRYRLSFTSPFKCYIDLIEQIITDLFPDISVVRCVHTQDYHELFGYEYFDKNFYKLEVSSKDIYNYLNKFKKAEDRWVVPFGYPRDFQYGFIGGIIDSEGSLSTYCISITNKNKENIEQLQKLLLSLGFKYGKVSALKEKKRGTFYYILNINGSKNLKLILNKCRPPYKKEKLKRKIADVESNYKYSVDDYMRAIELWNNNIKSMSVKKTTDKILKITGIPPQTIYGWVYRGTKPLSVQLKEKLIGKEIDLDIIKKTDIQHERRLKLYNKGLNDKQIADKTNVCRSALHYWRKVNNLPPNHTRGKL